VAQYVRAGCTCPVLYPLGADVPAMIDAFSQAQTGGPDDAERRTGDGGPEVGAA